MTVPVTDLVALDEAASTVGLQLIGHTTIGRPLRLYTDTAGALHYVDTEDLGYCPLFADVDTDDIVALTKETSTRLHAVLAVITDAATRSGDPAQQAEAALVAEVITAHDPNGLVAATTVADYTGYPLDAYEADCTLEPLDYDTATRSGDNVVFFEVFRHIPTGRTLGRVGSYCSCCGPTRAASLDDLEEMTVPDAREKFAARVRQY